MYELVRAILAGHQELKELLDQLQAAGENDTAVRDWLFKELQRSVEHHVQEVEQFLYHPLEKNKNLHQGIQDGYKEHRTIKALVAELEPISTSSVEWGPRFEMVRKSLLEHLDKGETRLLPQIELEIDPSQIQHLGAQLLRSRSRHAA